MERFNSDTVQGRLNLDSDLCEFSAKEQFLCIEERFLGNHHGEIPDQGFS